MRVINRLSERDAERLGLDAKEARSIFRVDDGKSNLAPPADQALYRKMIGVQLDNSEWVGVTVPYELPDEWSGMSEAVVNEMLRQIDTGLSQNEEGEDLYSIRPQDKSRWVGSVILDYPFANPDDAKTEIQTKGIVRKWLETGLIEIVDYYAAAQRKTRKGVRSTGRIGEQR